MTFRSLIAAAYAVMIVVGFAPLATAQQEPTVTLTIKDHKFDPTDVEVPAGVKIKLIVKNTDATPEEFESIELRREKVIPGGQEGIVFVGPLKPGRYEFFGDFNPKSARGHLIAK